MGKNLSAYLNALGPLVRKSVIHEPEQVIRGVANDSRRVGKDFIFCAIKGVKSDGHCFISDAVRNGASVIFASDEVSVPERVSVIYVSDSYHAWGVLCAEFFDNPADHLDIFAVTGTNGKTSIAFMLKRILTAHGLACGLISTVEYDDGGKAPPEEAARTTPDSYSIQELFARMLRNGCRCAVIEASSHGLHQHRTGNVRFAGAVFTNLTGDHLDYHHTMEAYYQAKKLLFSEMLRPGAPAVVNIDDEWGSRLVSELPGKRVLTLSRKNPDADGYIHSVSLSGSGTEFSLRTAGREIRIKSVLIGEHNVCNMSLAALAAYACGVPAELIAETLSAPDIAPPGRLEPFGLPNGARAFVDYAHTDDALFRVLTAIRAFCKGRIITVFGCGGDRDRTKRPRMASVVSELSDISIVTSDNPRTEDPRAIIAEILPGIRSGAEYFADPDRRSAILKAAAISRRDDIILIAGKGHENYQEINGVRHHFDDREILRSIQQNPL